MAIEEPLYTVTQQEGAIEVRDYPALIAAEVTVSGERAAAIKTGFRLLASYIFGENTPQQPIAMTAPVIQATADPEKIPMTAPVIQIAADNAWRVRFIMPRAYKLETLPKPSDPRVSLITLAATRFAVIRFSGLTTEAHIEQKTAALNSFIAFHDLQIEGRPSLARYNPPWTLWFLRRNEIMMPINSEINNG